MKNDLLTGWVAFLASSAAPAMTMRPLELEGYLTGLVVAPDLIPPSLWIPYLWGDDEPVFDNTEQMQAALDSVMGHYNAIIRQIDNQIDGNGPVWLPMYFDENGIAKALLHKWLRVDSLTESSEVSGLDAQTICPNISYDQLDCL